MQCSAMMQREGAKAELTSWGPTDTMSSVFPFPLAPSFCTLSRGGTFASTQSPRPRPRPRPSSGAAPYHVMIHPAVMSRDGRQACRSYTREHGAMIPWRRRWILPHLGSSFCSNRCSARLVKGRKWPGERKPTTLLASFGNVCVCMCMEDI